MKASSSHLETRVRDESGLTGREARKTASELAWGSFAWFAAEPDHVVVLARGGKLSDFLK